MAITAAQLVAKVSVEGDAEAKAKLQGVGQEAQQTGEKAKEAGGGLSGMFKEALSFAAGQAIFAGIGFLKDQIASVFDVTLAHQGVITQLNNVLRSTHDVSGMTASALNDLADSFSKTTKFSADTVLGGENLLLTFTNIGQSVFPQATQAILDVSQAMGQDLKSSAIQVGKALGDPLTGMTALQRIGVTFSASEKEQIKTMMAHNDIIGAQKVILKELSTEFGGSATAAGKTFGGQMDILKNQMEDLKIKIGTALLPVLTGFLNFITGTVLPGLSNFKDMVGQILAPLGVIFHVLATTAQGAFKDIGDTLKQVGDIFKSVFGGIGGGSNPLTTFLTGLAKDAVPLIHAVGTAFHDFMMDLQKNLSTINPQDILDFFARIGKAFDDFKGYVMPVLQTVGGIIGGQLKDDFNTFLGIVQNLASWWQSTMAPAIQKAMPGFLALGNVLFTQVVPALAGLWAAGHKIIDALLPVFMKAFETLAPIIVKVGGFIAGLLTQAIKYVLPFIMQAAKEIVKFAKEIAERAMPIITKLGELIGGVLGFIMDHWSAIWGVLGPIVLGVFNVIKGIIQVAWAVISGIFKVALDLISGNWSKAWEDVKDTLHGVWDGIVSIFKGAFGILSGILGGWINSVLGFFQGLWDKLTGHSIIPDMINSIVDFFKGLPGRVLSAIESLLGKLSTWAYNTWTELHTRFTTGLDRLITLVKSLPGKVMDAVGSLLTKLAVWAYNTWTDLHDRFDRGLGKLIDLVKTLPGKALSAVGGLLGQLAGFFGGLANQALTWGANILSNLASGIIGAIASTIGNAMSAVGTFIHDHLPSSPAKRGPLRDLATQGSKISEQIAQGMVSGIPKLQSSLNLVLAPLAMTPMMASGGGSSSSAQPINVNVYLAGAPVAKALMPHIAQAIRTSTGAKF